MNAWRGTKNPGESTESWEEGGTWFPECCLVLSSQSVGRQSGFTKLLGGGGQMNPFSIRVYTEIHSAQRRRQRRSSLWWQTRCWNCSVCPRQLHLDHMSTTSPPERRVSCRLGDRRREAAHTQMVSESQQATGSSGKLRLGLEALPSGESWSLLWPATSGRDLRVGANMMSQRVRGSTRDFLSSAAKLGWAVWPPDGGWKQNMDW